MRLKEVIEKLIKLQSEGLNECDVVFYQNDELIRIESIEKEIIYKVLLPPENILENEEEEKEYRYLSLQEMDEYDLIEKDAENKEILIKILAGNDWYFEAQKDEELEKRQLLELQDKYGSDLEKLILGFLKENGVGDDRGFSPLELRQKFKFVSGIDMRAALYNLRQKDLIKSTGGCRAIRFVANEYYDAANKKFELELLEIRKLK